MDFLKRYQIKLTARSPVFIGSGMTMGKKEYVYDRTRHKVKIPDLPSMFSGIEKLGLMKHFEEYMLESREDLYKWLSRVGIFPNVYNQWIRYELDAGDAVMEERSKKEIHLFIKDPLGLPYIPGSSMKGAIRSSLLTKDILQDNRRKASIMDSVRRAREGNRKWYLVKEAGMMEAGTFMKLKRNEKKPFDPINDYMAAVRISDSKPLQLDDLVLCQKIDLNLSGETKPMPLIRECLKPGTVVEFDLTIDT
ncbi:MAG: type III-A CRISPR-associated RAMP protein Csm5, partial [Clostridia bacterium]|nr:type III-A CRISPR-associated RAMP protein Csm5 [Clostridia bacterium]